MLLAIPPKRLFLYFTFFLTLPLLYSAWSIFHQTQLLASVEQELIWVGEQAVEKMRRELPNQRVRQKFAEADRFYLNKQVEPLALLEEEKALLTQTLEAQGIASQDSVEQRLLQLSEENQIVFTEGSRVQDTHLQEVIESFQRPVEMSAQDLIHLLKLVEGSADLSEELEKQRPQLIITDLRLDKRSSLSGSETFFVHLKLLKREFGP